MSRTIPSFAEEGLKRFLHGMDRRIKDLERGGDWDFDQEFEAAGGTFATRNAAQLLCMSAVADPIESDGDNVTFSSIRAQHGFVDVGAPSDGWVHPVDSPSYVLTYSHEWLGGYDGGGSVYLTVDGLLIPEGEIAHGSSGDGGTKTLTYRATEGSVGRIWIVQESGSAQTCDATVHVAISDPLPTSAVGAWDKVFDGDAFGIVFDGTYWWLTEGYSGVTVSQYDADWTLVSSFEAPTATQTASGGGEARVRGIDHDGTNLWLVGGDSAIYKVSPAGTTVNAYVVSSDWSVTRFEGLAHTGADLWVIIRGDDTLHGGADAARYSLTGSFQLGITMPGSGTLADATWHDGHLWIADTANSAVLKVTTTGSVVATIDVSEAVTGPTGVWIDPSGVLYVSKDGDGVYRRTETV